MPKNRVEMKLMRGNHTASKTPKPDIELYKRQVAKGRERQEEVNPAMIYNLANFPIVIDYGREKLRLSPKASMKIANHELLKKEKLPKEIALKQIPKRKKDIQAKSIEQKIESEPEKKVAKKRGRKKATGKKSK
jgi:hypothetical protein